MQKRCKKPLTNANALGIITFALLEVHNFILVEDEFRLWRNTQEAEEAPLLRV